MWITIKNGESRAIPTFRNGCKSSENLVDDRVPEHRDSHASSSHESSLEPALVRSADFGNYCVYTHFPKDRNCEICQRTKISRTPCRRRTGRVVPRAENLADLITADHKVLSEGSDTTGSIGWPSLAPPLHIDDCFEIHILH